LFATGLIVIHGLVNLVSCYIIAAAVVVAAAESGADDDSVDYVSIAPEPAIDKYALVSAYIQKAYCLLFTLCFDAAGWATGKHPVRKKLQETALVTPANLD